MNACFSLKLYLLLSLSVGSNCQLSLGCKTNHSPFEVNVTRNCGKSKHELLSLSYYQLHNDTNCYYKAILTHMNFSVALPQFYVSWDRNEIIVKSSSTITDQVLGLYIMTKDWRLISQDHSEDATTQVHGINISANPINCQFEQHTFHLKQQDFDNITSSRLLKYINEISFRPYGTTLLKTPAEPDVRESNYEVVFTPYAEGAVDSLSVKNIEKIRDFNEQYRKRYPNGLFCPLYNYSSPSEKPLSQLTDQTSKKRLDNKIHIAILQWCSLGLLIMFLLFGLIFICARHKSSGLNDGAFDIVLKFSDLDTLRLYRQPIRLVQFHRWLQVLKQDDSIRSDFEMLEPDNGFPFYPTVTSYDQIVIPQNRYSNLEKGVLPYEHTRVILPKISVWSELQVLSIIVFFWIAPFEPICMQGIISSTLPNCFANVEHALFLLVHLTLPTDRRGELKKAKSN